MSNYEIYVAASDTYVGGTDGQAAQAAEPSQTTATTQVAAPPPQGGIGGILASPNTQLLATMAIVFGIMYFFTIRPQRKREKELREIQNSIQPGDWVVTFSGMYGKVADAYGDTIIVEFGLNKGVRIPVRRTDMTKCQEPNLSLKSDAIEETSPSASKAK